MMSSGAKLSGAFLSALMLITSTSANAQSSQTFMSGNKLLSSCEGGNLDQIVCMSYIVGVVDTQDGVGVDPKLRKLQIPKTVTPGQLKDIVVRFLKAHPEHRDALAAQLVFMALSQHY